MDVTGVSINLDEAFTLHRAQQRDADAVTELRTHGEVGVRLVRRVRPGLRRGQQVFVDV
jgi:hypothetical protein